MKLKLKRKKKHYKYNLSLIFDAIYFHALSTALSLKELCK